MRTYLSLLLALALSSPLMQAQELRGSVRGVVTDSTGGVVAGAKLLLRNINTNIQAERETNANGAYLFDFITAGTYTLTIGHPGFRSYEQQNILVQTRSDITVDAKLEVGAVSETVRIEESPVSVNFNKTTMETTLDMKIVPVQLEMENAFSQ